MKYFPTLFLFCSLLILKPLLYAQEAATYQMPPPAIAELADAPLPPVVSLSPGREWMALLERPSYPSIEELAQGELRLAGIRINPATNGASRSSFYNGLRLKNINSGKEVEVKGLPEGLRLENISWSPDGTKIVATNTISNGMELWLVEIENATARKLTGAVVNDAMPGNPYEWLSDSKAIIYKSILPERGPQPVESTAPRGPVVQFNEGKEAPVRTYQDLLKNKHDESLFEYFATSQLMLIELESGKAKPFLEPGIIYGFEPSPNGQYLLATTLHHPFSYLVPYYRFPQKVSIYDRKGQLVKDIAQIPLVDDIPIGFGAVQKGPRSFTWRADAPAILYWVEAQDEGDPHREAKVRDKLFYLEAPFKGTAKEGISFALRYGGITWGNDRVAIASEWWWQDRREITSRWQPADPAGGKTAIFDRSREDSYNDPGTFETTTNQYGRQVLLTTNDGNILYLTGSGASPEGNRPFVDQFELESQSSRRLWRSEAPFYEYPIEILDAEKGIVMTRRESKKEPPNYFVRNLNSRELEQLTFFKNPYQGLEDVEKQLIKYQREDGVELTGTLYLPQEYDPARDGRLPVFMWAYPREFKSAKAAGQVTDSPYEFIRLYWGSPIYWITQGYAVFDDFGMPIIGEGDEEPNDDFVAQLRMSAKAAVHKLVEMGVADAERLAVGGHSYGAFMTGNLLAHTDLFAAGIARSGAYNRTLTPFGFQSEERTFWEAPEVYFKMSPFMHADQIKEPLLLIHGEADNNSGTFPIQSDRFYAALKGHGATVRLVMLPHESHGYRARESIMHMLWEMDQWLDKYVKNKATR